MPHYILVDMPMHDTYRKASRVYTNCARHMKGLNNLCMSGWRSMYLIYIGMQYNRHTVISAHRTKSIVQWNVQSKTSIVYYWETCKSLISNYSDKIANKRDKSTIDIGTIRVEIKLVCLGRPVDFEGYEARNVGVVHEQAKKAGAHCTRWLPPIFSCKTMAS